MNYQNHLNTDPLHASLRIRDQEITIAIVSGNLGLII